MAEQAKHEIYAQAIKLGLGAKITKFGGDILSVGEIQYCISNALALKDHIKNINAESQAWMKENPGSWAGMLCEDPAHWASRGVLTIGDFENYIEAEHENNMRKNRY